MAVAQNVGSELPVSRACRIQGWLLYWEGNVAVSGAIPQAGGPHGTRIEARPLLTTLLASANPEASWDVSTVALNDVILAVLYPLSQGRSPRHFFFEARELLIYEKHLQNNSIGWDDVFYFLGPGVHETEPSTSQRDERTIFDFKLIAISCDLFSRL